MTSVTQRLCSHEVMNRVVTENFLPCSQASNWDVPGAKEGNLNSWCLTDQSSIYAGNIQEML